MRYKFAAAVIAITVASVCHAQNSSATVQTPWLSIEGGLISVSARKASVRALLEELRQHIPVKISIAHEIEDDEISANLKGAPLEAGVRMLLANYDAFFYFGGPGQEASLLRGIWVFPKGSAFTMQPASLQACAAGKELEAVLADANPRVRQQAYEALLTRPDSRSRELVIQALRGSRERDDEVRQRIFSTALSHGLEIPPDVLSDIVRADPSEHLRWMALDALSNSGGAAQHTAQAALNDMSPVVRQKAEEILSVLGAESLRRQGGLRTAEQQP
jgi:hypothetical protein